MLKHILRFFLILVSITGAAILALAVIFRLNNKTNGELESSGERRRYLLYVPASYDPETPAPLVITIHGFAQWPAHQMYISRWNELADELGLIVVYPMGTGFPLRWRTFEQNGDEDGPTREVQFIADLIDKLEMDYNIDPRRIYANGLSNGGGMTFLLACRLSDRIAAIGTVAGAYSYPWDACSPTRSVPLIAFHGDSDPIVPYLGGSRSRTGYTFPNLQDWIKEYARRNGCVETPLDLVVSESVSGVRYSSCRDEAEVVFYTIRGGGHTWPGGEAIPEWIAGYTSPAIDSTRVMWQFFQQHPLEK